MAELPPLCHAPEALQAIACRVAQVGAWQLDLAADRVLWSDVVATIHGMPAGHEPRLAEALDYYVEPHRARLVQAVEACRDHGEPFDLELVLRPADERGLRWVRSIGEAVRDAEGRITLLRGACQDITDRKSQQMEIQRLAEQLSATLESMTDGFVALDRDWRVLLVNRGFEHMTSLSRADAIGRSLLDLRPRTEGSTFYQRAQQVLSSGQPAEFEVFHKELERHLELRVFPTGDGLSVYCRDITDRKQQQADRQALESRLRQAQKLEAIGTLAGGIAHDFNNILGAILGNLSLAQEQLPPGSAALAPLDAIAASAVRARALVQQILAFGRQQPTQRTAQSLQRLVRETVELLRSTLPASVTIATQLAATELVADVDGNQLQQVLINLCTNAWHAMPAGGLVVIGLEATGDAPAQAHLWIRDHGCGMDADTQVRIFEPFFTTKPVGQGTGLGLSVVHGIVVAHGGQISVDSTPGEGSIFHILLPLSGLPPGAGADAAAPSRCTGLAGLRVLCVDDDPVMLLTVHALLERAGCHVEAHVDPQQALHALHQAPAGFDVLVTDYSMPGMDGLQLARAARSVAPQLALVLASGFLGDALCEQAQALGVQALVQKERTVEDLLDAVCAAAGQSPLDPPLKRP
jgi:PAS domain S-box-containing protein